MPIALGSIACPLVQRYGSAADLLDVLDTLSSDCPGAASAMRVRRSGH
jgi:hypothetical protein